MKGQGDIVRINGNPYLLGPKIGGGLEGSVFEIGSGPDSKTDYTKFVIKIINDSKMNDFEKTQVSNHFRQLQRIIDKNTGLRRWMALPKAVLDPGDVGYVMLKADGYSKLTVYTTFPDEEDPNELLMERYTLRRRYEVIRTIFKVLREIHICGYVFTDLSPNNILVKRFDKDNVDTNNSIVFIDTDNMRSGTEAYLGVLGTPGYMAPELYRKAPENIAGRPIKSSDLNNCGRISVDSDIFSAAIIAFELLTLRHPFKGDAIDSMPPEEEEKAERIETDYILKKGTENTSESGLVGFFDYITTNRIRELFYRTFVNGKEHPELRPTDVEFYEAFDEAIDNIVTCPNCGFSKIYNMGQNNECCACKSEYPEQIGFRVCSKFIGCNNAEGLNTIHPEDATVLSGIGLIKDGKVSNDEYELSRMILVHGQERIVCRRHIVSDERNDSESILRIRLSDSADKIEAQRISKKNSKICVVSSNGKERALEYDKALSFNMDHMILFDRREQEKGYLLTYGEFFRC